MSGVAAGYRQVKDQLSTNELNNLLLHMFKPTLKRLSCQYKQFNYIPSIHDNFSSARFR